MNDKPELTEQSKESALGDAVDEFTELLNSGKQPDIDEFLSRYAGYADTLQPILETLAAMRQEPQEEPYAAEFVPDGAALGDFRILQEIGRGGMGIVYEAQQISLKRRVALKVLPFAALLDQRQLQRFRTEARAAAMLKHPNIVSVYSIGCERGVNYYAMELIDGPSLAEVLAASDRSAEALSPKSHVVADDASTGGAVDTQPIAALSTQLPTNRTSFYRRVAELGVEVAEALQYAHVEGVIHRDIKPANLLLDETGKPHVADFGLARMQSGADLTMTGDLVGTLRYMSPEQGAGDRMVDQRTDIYSLGLTLYELIVRRPAFEQASRPELIKAIADAEPTPLNKLDNRLPTDLTTIVHKAIAKEPEDRYQQASELAEDLRRFLDHRTILAKRSTQFERLGRLIRRNRVIASLLVSVFVLLLGLSVVSSVAALRFAAHAEQQTVQTRKQKLGLYAREMRLAHLAIDGQQIVHAKELLTKWIPGGEEDHRGFEWYHLWARCDRALAPWTISHDSYIYDVAFSPDGRYLADASIDMSIRIWDTTKRANEKQVTRIDLPTQAMSTLKTTHDGAFLMGGGESGYIGIWDWQTYEVVDSHNVQTEHSRNFVHAISMNREQTLVAIAAFHGIAGTSIVVWDREHDQQTIVAKRRGKAWTAFDSAGHLIVGTPVENKIDAIDASTGEIVHRQPLGGAWNAAEVFRDGTHVAVCYSRHHGDVKESRLEVRRTDDWQLVMSAFLGEGSASDVCITHDGREIAVGNTNGQVLQVSLDGQQIQRRAIYDDAIRSLVYSPDGRHFASTERTRHAYVFPRELPIASQTLVTRCRVPPTVVTGIGFVDEGRTVCTNEGGDVIRFWDAHTGKLRGDSLQLEKGPWNNIRIQTDPLNGIAAFVQTNWPFDLRTDDSNKRVNIVRAKVTLWDDQRKSIIGDPILMDDEVFNHIFSADGRYVAVCGLHSLKLIDTQTDEVIDNVFRTDQLLPSTQGWLYACAFSSDTKRLYCGMLNGETHVYEVETWKKLGKFQADSTRLQSLSTSADGRFLGSCGFDCRLKLFHPTSHVLLRESERVPMYPSYVRFSTDGERAVVGSPEGVVRIYSTETAEEVLRIDVPNHYTVCEFSPDGNSIAIASVVDAMVVHAPNRRAIAPLSKTEFRNRIDQDSKMYRPKESK